MMVLKDAQPDQKPNMNKRLSRGGANIQGGGTSGESGVYKVLQTIMDKNMSPVIVFSFSKKENERKQQFFWLSPISKYENTVIKI